MTKTPKLRDIHFLSWRIEVKKDCFCLFCVGEKCKGAGTNKISNPIHNKDKIVVSQKSPCIPCNICVKKGPKIKANVKAAPIVIPIIAITRERHDAGLRSAANAIVTEPIAPTPCKK